MAVLVTQDQKQIFFDRVNKHRSEGMVPAGQVYPPPRYSPDAHDRYLGQQRARLHPIEKFKRSADRRANAD